MKIQHVYNFSGHVHTDDNGGDLEFAVHKDRVVVNISGSQVTLSSKDWRALNKRVVQSLKDLKADADNEGYDFDE